MYKRLIVIVAIIITFINCETKKYSIEGNWYRYYIDKVDSIPFGNYEEIYFTKDTIFSFTTLGGYVSPRSYKTVNDTLINTSVYSKFIIDKVTENSIKYSNEYGFQFEMKKQTEKPTLEDFIRKKIKRKNYSESFFARFQKIENKRLKSNQ